MSKRPAGRADYVTQAGRGGGFGRKMPLWLTVNKDNAGAIAWYTRKGFKNAGAIVQDIGMG